MKKRIVLSLYITGLICSLLFAGTTTVYAQYEEQSEKTASKKSVLDSSERFFNTRESNEPFVYEQMPVPTIQRKKVDEIKKGKEFWYIDQIDSAKNSAEKKIAFQFDSLQRNGGKPERVPNEQLSTQDSAFYSPAAQTIFWVIIIAVFVGAIVYFLATNKVGFWAPRDKKEKALQPDDDILGENIFTIPYKDLLDKACKEGNYRLAVRILYLQTLKILSDRQMIRFQPEYTNIHYLMQLANTDYQQDFSVITRHYEYVWYGKFTISKELYEKLSSDFDKIQKRIR